MVFSHISNKPALGVVCVEHRAWKHKQDEPMACRAQGFANFLQTSQSKSGGQSSI
eukprot:NODE_7013_length_478_cov_6.198135_g6206_i0.p5 GENE.NODE_7013_length_478_cov_6.198135_g6206_i0~~NODE_7013_length_478_cov_6.198135_g6206_i0.p5  ORF type:complete len:55 (-),score=8.12 NODE_7013_length_478_cov_6.198135_g6206_i0:208-372(-)